MSLLLSSSSLVDSASSIAIDLGDGMMTMACTYWSRVQFSCGLSIATVKARPPNKNAQAVLLPTAMA